jgi:hypothetical protein
MGKIEEAMDIEEFQELTDKLTQELEDMVKLRYSEAKQTALQNKKMDLYDMIEKLKRRVELY